MINKSVRLPVSRIIAHNFTNWAQAIKYRQADIYIIT